MNSKSFLEEMEISSLGEAHNKLISPTFAVPVAKPVSIPEYIVYIVCFILTNITTSTHSINNNMNTKTLFLSRVRLGRSTTVSFLSFSTGLNDGKIEYGQNM